MAPRCRPVTWLSTYNRSKGSKMKDASALQNLPSSNYRLELSASNHKQRRYTGYGMGYVLYGVRPTYKHIPHNNTVEA